MDTKDTGEVEAPDARRLLPIVIGAHLRAELADRPLGYRLREEILRWQQKAIVSQAKRPAGGPAAATEPLVPVVCTDLWYLNTPDLMTRPTICIGEPQVNAASAYFANRLPTALVIDETLRVHLDPEFIDLQACVWGASDAATASGVDLFEKRYLAPFLRAAHGMPTEEGD